MSDITPAEQQTRLVALNSLNAEIAEAHRVLAETFELLHHLHHKRGELMYAAEARTQAEGE